LAAEQFVARKPSARRGLLILAALVALGVVYFLRRGSTPADLTPLGGAIGADTTAADTFGTAGGQALTPVGPTAADFAGALSGALAPLSDQLAQALAASTVAADAAQAAADAASSWGTTPPDWWIPPSDGGPPPTVSESPPPETKPTARAAVQGVWWGGQFFTSLTDLNRWRHAHGSSVSDAAFAAQHPAALKALGLPPAPPAPARKPTVAVATRKPAPKPAPTPLRRPAPPPPKTPVKSRAQSPSPVVKKAPVVVKKAPARYYTYKRQVPLRPGQTLHYTPGRGYYAA
jgi:hypothetical protein